MCEHAFVGRHCCLWCTTEHNEMKKSPKDRKPSKQRSLENMEASIKTFKPSGGKINKAKKFDNVIREPLMKVRAEGRKSAGITTLAFSGSDRRNFLLLTLLPLSEFLIGINVSTIAFSSHRQKTYKAYTHKSSTQQKLSQSTLDKGTF